MYHEECIQMRFLTLFKGIQEHYSSWLERGGNGSKTEKPCKHRSLNQSELCVQSHLQGK